MSKSNVFRDSGKTSVKKNGGGGGGQGKQANSTNELSLHVCVFHSRSSELTIRDRV